METKQDDGGPAFPCEGGDLSGLHSHPGMTLRDYFAAKAMQGWLASFGPESSHPASCGDEDGIAKASYQLADAMLAARKATP